MYNNFKYLMLEINNSIIYIFNNLSINLSVHSLHRFMTSLNRYLSWPQYEKSQMPDSHQMGSSQARYNQIKILMTPL